MTNTRKVILMVFIAILYFAFDTLLQAGFFYSINPSTNKDVEIISDVYGPEDMEWDWEKNVVFISSTNRRAFEKGEPDIDDGIYILTPKNNNVFKLSTDFIGEFHPHGLSLFKQEGKQYLYVVNHSSSGSSVELFHVEDSSLIHLKTYTHEIMFSPNDVVGNEIGKFYVTNDHGNKSSKGKMVENYLRMPYSYVLYFDGVKYKKAYQGLVYANGIQFSNSGDQVFVTHTIGHELIVLKRDKNTGNLREHKKLNLSAGLDNIDVDLDGNIWVASHPKLLKFGAHKADSQNYSPSKVIKILTEKNKYEASVIFENDGSLLSGSSVAVSNGQTVYVGCVFDKKILKIKL
ncbi:MAG: SMP-30/gluconolactonase/LRE family protein [Salibacteraceae bacterium]